jgi:hypothetical protein
MELIRGQQGGWKLLEIDRCGTMPAGGGEGTNQVGAGAAFCHESFSIYFVMLFIPVYYQKVH